MPEKPHLTVGSMQFHKQQRQPKAAVSPFVMHATRKDERFAITAFRYLRCYHRSTNVQSTVSTTALTVASSTRSASASSAATDLR